LKSKQKIKQDDLTLRKVIDADLKIFFNQQRDKEANYMVAFNPRDPENLDEFMTHWQKILNDPNNIIRTIEVSGKVVGNIMSFIMFGKREIGYWIGKAHWGRGIATIALKNFVSNISERPLSAHVAFDNLGSISVLERCGFKQIGEDEYFSKTRDQNIKELIFELM
jgi:RimJ/RimL family protein N-acetyltransferase